MRSAWFEKLPFSNTTAISNAGGCVRQRKCCELHACRMQRCQSSELRHALRTGRTDSWLLSAQFLASLGAEAGVSVFNGQHFRQGQTREEQASRGLSTDTNTGAPVFPEPHKGSPALPLPDAHFAEKCSAPSHLTWIWALLVGCFQSSGSYQNGWMRRS